MSTSEQSTQTAAERRAAGAELRGLVAKLAPTHADLVAAVRRWLRKRLPTAHEVVYEYADCVVVSYTPSGRGYEGVLAIRAGAEGVRLCVGVSGGLPDPEKLLHGSGKQMRWLDVESASTLRRPAVAALADGAIAGSRVPFAASGRGPIVLAAATAKKRRARPSA